MEKGGAIRDYLKAAIEGRRPSDVGCLDEERLLAFYSTEMMDSEKEAIRDHLADCPRCLNLAREAKEFLNAIGEPLRSPPSIGLVQREPERAGAHAEKDEWWRFLLNFSLRPAVAYSMAAAMLLMLIGGSFLVIRVGQLKSEVAHIRAEQDVQELEKQLAEERTRSESLAGQLKREQGKTGELELASRGSEPPGKQSVSTAAIASLMLVPTFVRDITEANTLTIPGGTSLVRLQVNLEEVSYKSYRAVIRTADGDPVWESKRALKPNKGKSIAVTLSPARFVKRDHVMRLIGVTADGNPEDVNQYVFRVVKR